MNKPVLAIIFILKTHFLFIFLDFLISWTRRQKLKSAGSLALNIPRHRPL
jgi:hypothetical protein